MKMRTAASICLIASAVATHTAFPRVNPFADSLGTGKTPPAPFVDSGNYRIVKEVGEPRLTKNGVEVTVTQLDGVAVRRIYGIPAKAMKLAGVDFKRSIFSEAGNYFVVFGKNGFLVSDKAGKKATVVLFDLGLELVDENTGKTRRKDLSRSSFTMAVYQMEGGKPVRRTVTPNSGAYASEGPTGNSVDDCTIMVYVGGIGDYAVGPKSGQVRSFGVAPSKVLGIGDF